MTAERWALITSVFRSALDRPAERRAAFLADACGTDEALRRNVERLFAAQSVPTLPCPAAELLAATHLEFSPGESAAQYRIEKKIGEGGMGVVYLAHDTRLQRKVALKVLSPFFASTGNRNLWLLHEARAAGALNHPNIVAIYECGADLDLDFIAMEYVEGKRLDEIIRTGGLPAGSVLKYGIQIANALATAHDAGILHRDLKPSNIMVTPGDRIKILDFGLAKPLEPNAENTPADGELAGTPAYMSPEQAQAREFDARSEVFSFGAVLYEMATGLRAFAAENQTAILRKVIAEDPRPPGQIAQLPSGLEKLILRCLAKNPSDRWQSMAEVERALERLARPRSAKPIAIAALAIAASLALVLLEWRPSPRVSEGGNVQTVKFTISPPNLSRGADNEIDAEVSVSPDGKHITYVESPNGQLWVRDLDQERARIVPGATRVYQVFWSPDSRNVGYSVGLRDLVRIPLEGGVATPVAKLAGDFRQASWSADGKTILYADTTGLYTVPATGGAATRLVSHPHIEHPSWLNLPDGRRAVLYQAVDGTPKHGIYVRVPGEAQHRLVILTDSGNPYPAYSPTGHIVYADGDGESSAIWAIPFSLNELRATGKPFLVAQPGSSPQVSTNGTLVYSDVPSLRLQLTMHERGSATSRPLGGPERRGWFALSPDGRKLAVRRRQTSRISGSTTQSAVPGRDSPPMRLASRVVAGHLQATSSTIHRIASGHSICSPRASRRGANPGSCSARRRPRRRRGGRLIGGTCCTKSPRPGPGAT
jgi:eukaryotic-like serine/threonine-protein kinase